MRISDRRTKAQGLFVNAEKTISAKEKTPIKSTLHECTIIENQSCKPSNANDRKSIVQPNLKKPRKMGTKRCTNEFFHSCTIRAKGVCTNEPNA
jgi:hypothetical protein